MRLHDSLDETLSTKARTRVARILVGHRGHSLTGREVGRLSGLSPAQAREALITLERTGLADGTIAGRTKLWRLGEEHVLAPHLVALFAAEKNVFPALTEELRRFFAQLPVKSVRLFGSAARGAERPDSDIDLYVEVASEKDKALIREKVGELWARGARRFGNPIMAVVYTTKERQADSGSGLIRSAFSDGTLIAGE